MQERGQHRARRWAGWEVGREDEAGGGKESDLPTLKRDLTSLQ
jgi:hypothetical protein